MEAIFISSSGERSFSPYKQLKNIPKRNIGANFVSNPNENLAPTYTINGGGGGGGGVLFAPPPSLSFSYPPSGSLLNPIFYQQMQQRQPPLLPFPSPNKPPHSSLPSRTRSLSSSPSNRKNHRSRDQSLTPKRSSSKQLIPGKIEDRPNKDHLKPTEATKTKAISNSPVTASVNPLGPDPSDLPKVLKPSYIATGSVAKDLEKFSGSVFTLSPPPSSLPLPKFSLRPKLGCNAEAAEFDVGATDNLRRLLRLH
ncbi:hypothetical protein Goarm_009055 [Gossypium armourianum]|uniref:Uncharacterized protein n=1 Tax=Gossypium armourianum TaxID=34283 RepID=A0A7J9JRQ9_9ROSI|nr:hypothetical protein [Gossypium armourianum]